MSKFSSIRGVLGTIVCALTAFAAMVAPAEESWSVQQLHSFGNAAGSANHASYGLMLARDGKLYGTAFWGGPNGGGIVFRLDRSGGHYEIIHAFSSQREDSGGNEVAGNVVEASDGKLYGATVGGGTNAGGTIFRLNPDGSNFEVIHYFDTSEDFGGPDPQDKLVEAADGKLYGVTRYGGSSGAGTVYRINKDGSGFEVLHEFDIAPELKHRVFADGMVGSEKCAKTQPRHEGLRSMSLKKCHLA